MDKSHATYPSPQDLLRSYQPSEVPFSVPLEEEISERENDVLLIPIDVPDSSEKLNFKPLDLEEEIIEQEEEISIVPISIPESSEELYSAPLDHEDEIIELEDRPLRLNNLGSPLSSYWESRTNKTPIEEPNEIHRIRLNAPSSSTQSHTPYSVRYELPSPRSTIITQKDIGFLSDAGVRGSVSTVCHGTFHSQPATLLLFTFIFRSGDHGFRFKNASVKIDFSSHSSSSSTSPSTRAQEPSWTPSISALAPRKIYGLPTPVHQTRKLAGEISLQVPLGPTTLGPSTSLSHESSFSLSHRYSLVGNLWSQPHSASWDSVYWDLRENKQTKGGIPDRVDVGVVVCRGGGSF
ncbi:hypothetical protein BGAL_0661g00010 [Botrytis galanthina]|uniref:Uncharacterized protein n=1 Tax=Botrytis galanthina TaxID=278940 RepID=A0A4S8QI34_9HELO|nr:hypothetical protein BGAL_0661g00010 [Botrytis galanthina]